MKLRSLKTLGVLLLVALSICLTSVAAFATTNSVDVYLHDISDNTDSHLATYSRSDLETNFTNAKYNYSTVDCSVPPVYKYYTAKGPELEDVLENALGSSLDNVESIKFVASDDYVVELDKSSLLDTTRYYYDSVSHSLQYAVPAILATKYANGEDVADGSLSTSNTIRNFYGQTTEDDYTINNFNKNITTIYINVP
ncbi:hypothetical protein L9W92_04235 [Pelotomaculum terephthalicicum JT]|uniref:hypothetical protein n=1 Tax=Pelotomaculum terephthalicicum TaxID=206393 RepID=UPI001F04ACDB|nr:hypothetical protein [Pelotomaculum terephthalicicum]MCG9967263.1 hypothetical protein [Pelotomaculum terephthalicicum JT]